MAGASASPLMTRVWRIVPPVALVALAATWGRDIGIVVVGLVAALLAAAVLAAVHHAEVVAHRVGEPFGSLVLAVSVTVIEVSLIVTLMLAGGDEAALFAAELFAMYQKYAAARGWRFELLDYADSELGGMREGIAEITGRNVFARLKWESGVHRVQRVPATESQGRIHTSTATVAVLPEVEDVDITIDRNDVKRDVYRSSGPGGQSVNTTDSAVRLTHLPTGIVVSMQDEKSQLQNYERAMRVLRARLYEQKLAEQQAEIASERRSQVGSGERSEKIRTYIFPQARVTDHRVKVTSHNLDQVLAGDLREFTDALSGEEKRRRLEAQAGELAP